VPGAGTSCSIVCIFSTDAKLAGSGQPLNKMGVDWLTLQAIALYDNY
jgi:hypothetical protein